MKLFVGSDHAGFFLCKKIFEKLPNPKYHVGTYTTEPCDFPDIAEKLAQVLEPGDRGILVCGSGVGSCICANKFPGIRASVCHDTYSARQGIEHNDMNVLCLGERVIGEELACEIVRVFLSAGFLAKDKYIRRLGKIKAIEEKYNAG